MSNHIFSVLATLTWRTSTEALLNLLLIMVMLHKVGWINM